MSYLKVAVSLGVIGLAVALFMPVLLDSTQQNTEQTIELDEGESKDLTERLSVTSNDVAVNQSNVTIELENTDTLNRTTATINNSSVKTLRLSGDGVEVTIDSISSSNVTRSTLTYSPMLGWNSAARTFIENLEVVIIAVGFLMIAGLVIVAKP